MLLKGKKQTGIGLLELMLSLAIIAILLVMATRYFTSARQSQQVASAVSLVNAITAAASNYAATEGNGSAPGSMGALASFLPPESSTDPWGGTVKVGGTSATAFTIALGNAPADACTMIGDALANTGATAAATGGCTITVNLLGGAATSAASATP